MDLKPHIKLFSDTSVEIVGEHNPEDVATLLLLFSKGEMCEQMSEALIKSGVSQDWIDKYQKAAESLIKKEKKQEKYKGPVISSLEAFR